MNKIILAIALIAILLTPVLTFAGSSSDWQTNMNDVTTAANQLPNESVGTFVGDIIRWVLGLIGVILVALIVYGGFLYMTSAGNEDQVDRAKKVLTYSIIGLIVIVIAWIAADYIMSAVLGTTG